MVFLVKIEIDITYIKIINCSFKDVMEKDVNAESRKMAIQSLMLLENVIKQVSFPLH